MRREMAAACRELRATQGVLANVNEIACEKHDVKSAGEIQSLNVTANFGRGVRHVTKHVH